MLEYQSTKNLLNILESEYDIALQIFKILECSDEVAIFYSLTPFSHSLPLEIN